MLVLLLAALTRAQPCPEPPTEAELHELEAAALYRVGLELMADGRFSEACDHWRRLSAGYGDTEWSERALQQLGDVELVASRGCAEGLAPQVASARPLRNEGRTELMVSQAMVGPVLFGAFVPLAFELDGGPVIPVTLGLAGLGAGIGGTWAVTRHHPVSTGQAMTLYAGEVVGAWNGAWIAAASGSEARGTFASMALGTVGGGGLGLAVAAALDPTPGEAALVRSGATWGLGFGATSFLLVPGDPDRPRSVITRLGVATDLGLLGGLALAHLTSSGEPLSRARVNLVNLSGYAGAATGYGLVVIAGQIWDVSSQTIGVVAVSSSVVGLIVGTVLTRDVSGPDLGSGVALVERSGDRWVVGAPLPTVVPSGEGWTASVQLAAGRF